MGPILALIFSKLCHDESCFNIRSTDEAGPSGNATDLCTRSVGWTLGWDTDYPYVYGINQSQVTTLN